jgi:hypothetical protein
MKRALVLSLAVILGLGIGAFGQITGYWSTTLGIDPQPLSFVSMASTLKVDYALSGWTFGSVSTFDISGFSAQAFKVAGSLGAFTLVTNMTFAPVVATVLTSSLPLTLIADLVYVKGYSNVCPITWTATAWAPGFLTWDVTAGASIAGVAIEAYVLQDYSAANAVTNLNAIYLGSPTAPTSQTSSVTCASTVAEGMGWRLKIAGAFGAAKVTSYTYFNLWESTIAEESTAAVWCPAVGKSGVFTVGAGCNFPFTEEYLLIEGFSFGCATVDVALSIICTGFANVELVVDNIALGNWGVFAFGITFTTNHKSVATCITLTPLAGPCFTVDIGGFIGTKLDSLELYGFKFASTFGGVKFTSITELSPLSTLMSTASAYSYLNGDQVGFLVPVADIQVCPLLTGTYWTIGAGRYEMKCVTETKYALWEKFIIDVDADACCGGLFDLTVSTFFGDQEVLISYGYFVVAANATTYGTATTLYGLTPVAPVTALIGKTYDRVFPVALYGAGTQTQLFNWAKTDVALAVGIGSNVSLSAGFSLSVYGWDKITFGFKWSF